MLRRHTFCDYPDRLQRNLDVSPVECTRARDIERYLAAHILYLARLNIEAGDWDAARTLIDDPRTRALPTKRALQGARLTSGLVRQRLTASLTSLNPSPTLTTEQ